MARHLSNLDKMLWVGHLEEFKGQGSRVRVRGSLERSSIYGDWGLDLMKVVLCSYYRKNGENRYS